MLQKELIEQGEERGDDTAQADGKAAHGTLRLTHFHGLCRADGMTAGADTQTGRHGIVDTEQLDQERCHQISADAGDDHRCGGVFLFMHILDFLC